MNIYSLNLKEYHLATLISEMSSDLRLKLISVQSNENVDYNFNEVLNSEELEELNSVHLAHSKSSYSPPAIIDLTDIEFAGLPIHKIDFTIHLKKGIILSKLITKKPNGRPDTAEYTYNNKKIARIRWVFIDASGGLFWKRSEYLAHYNEDETLGEEFLINEVVIDFSIPNQLERSIDERIKARSSIVGEIKAVCSGALTVALQKSMEEVVTMIKPFWDTYKTDRDNFIELATPEWKEGISQASIETYPWLNSPVDSNGTTCRQYMLFRLGY